jgi:hypothetical protein
MHTQTSRRCWQPWHARAKWVARAFVRAEQWGLVQSSGFRVITGSLHLSPVSIASEVRAHGSSIENPIRRQWGHLRCRFRL